MAFAEHTAGRVQHYKSAGAEIGGAYWELNTCEKMCPLFQD